MSKEPAPPRTPDPCHDTVDDASLISDLRDGNLDAYEELWRRHIGPALRLARRLAPRHAEDLVAESFTVVLNQVTVMGGGPDKSFRAYLFTVMRHLALKWSKDANRLLPLATLDTVHDLAADDLPDRVIGDEDSRIVLQAFRTLPPRWQQALWLAEVDEEPRPVIAARFKMSPNAVSAMLRRARQGLRHRCLVECVPTDLRTDRNHVARVLPDLMMGKLSPDLAVKATAHLVTCATCREVHGELRALSGRVKHATLGTLGFGALTMLVSEVGTATVAAATTLAGGAAGGLLLTGSLTTGGKIAAVTVGVVVTLVPASGALPWASMSTEAAGALPSASATQQIANPVTTQATPAAAASAPTGTTQVTALPVIDLWHPRSADDTVTPAKERPAPVPSGSIPGPATTTTTATASPTNSGAAPSASTTSGASLTTPEVLELHDGLGIEAPTVSMTGTAQGFIPPVLSGSAEPDATVALSITRSQGSADPEDAVVYTVLAGPEGSWTFDLSDVDLDAAEYEAVVWQVVGDQSSFGALVNFTVSAIQVDGLPTQATLDEVAAELDGIIISIRAPGQLTACLSSSTGQEIAIPLEPSGTTSRRIRFVGAGTFDLSIAICDGERRGPAVHGTIEVTSSIQDPWTVVEPGILVEEIG